MAMPVIRIDGNRVATVLAALALGVLACVLPGELSHAASPRVVAAGRVPVEQVPGLRLVGQLDLDVPVAELVVAGNRLYVATGDALQIIDMSDPGHGTVVG